MERNVLRKMRLFMVIPWRVPAAVYPVLVVGETALGRRKRAGIPQDVRSKKKIELTMEMLDRANERGHLLFQWISGDCACGDAHEFWKHVAGMGEWYCFEVYCDTHVWTDDPAWKVSLVMENRRGRKPKNPKPTEESPSAVTAPSLVSSIPDNQWQRICLREEDKEPREEDVIVMNALPVYNSGHELTDEVIEGPHSAVFDEAQNRLHTQKAVMTFLMK